MSYKKVYQVTRPTGINGDWIDLSKPGNYTVGVSEASSFTQTYSISATAGVDAGIIVAKVSASGTFGASVALGSTTTWSYSATVSGGRRGTMARMRALWINGETLVTKLRWSPSSCKYVTAYRNQKADLPKKKDARVWSLQFATLRSDASITDAATKELNTAASDSEADSSTWSYEDSVVSQPAVTDTGTELGDVTDEPVGEAHTISTAAMPGGAGTVSCATDYDVSTSGRSVHPVQSHCVNDTNRTLFIEGASYSDATGKKYSPDLGSLAVAPGDDVAFSWDNTATFWSAKPDKPSVTFDVAWYHLGVRYAAAPVDQLG